jgi:uncharacterized membrane protein
MAPATASSRSCTPLELGHVSIDILCSCTGSFKKALFDIFSMILVTGVIFTIVIKAWPVFGTPLVLAQAPWFAG